jgi:hypothetical protein
VCWTGTSISGRTDFDQEITDRLEDHSIRNPGRRFIGDCDYPQSVVLRAQRRTAFEQGPGTGVDPVPALDQASPDRQASERIDHAFLRVARRAIV